MTSLVAHLASSLAATAQTAAKAVREAKNAETSRRSTRMRGQDEYDAALDGVMAAQAPQKTTGNGDEQTHEDRLEHPVYDQRAQRDGLTTPALDLEA